MHHELMKWMLEEEALRSLCADMSMPVLVLVLALCIVVLSKGADWMIDGVVDLAQRTGLPRIVIGATVVSLGTTSPEAFVSVMAAWMGNPGLALGNGVGSIICDTGMIFGLSCLLTRVPMDRYILNRTGWVQAGSAVILVLLALFAWAVSPDDPVLQRWVGIVLLSLLLAYLYAAYVWAKRAPASPSPIGDEGEENTGDYSSLPKTWTLLLGGLFCVIAGARVLIPDATELALRLGVPSDVIAATMVAFGTSLPELITAISAIRKGHPEITVGNIVGADVLNCLFVIGAAAAARPLAVPVNFFKFHFPAMLLILFSFRVFISMNGRGYFAKWQGACLLGIYLFYLLFQYIWGVSLPIE
jgi:cation:H+ antiporter